MTAFIAKWSYAFIVFGIALALIVSDYVLATRKNKDGKLNYADRRRLRGMFLIGIVLALVTAFVQWAAPE